MRILAKPTRLRIQGERLASDVEEGSPAFEAAIAERAAAPQPQSNGQLAADGTRILAYLEELKGQLVEKDQQIAARDQRIASVEEEATAQITKAYNEATAAVTAARKETAQAQAQTVQKANVLTTLAVGAAARLTERMAWLLAFLLRKLPLFAALAGLYVLSQEALAAPSALSAVHLTLFGLFAVGSTTWLAMKD